MAVVQDPKLKYKRSSWNSYWYLPRVDKGPSSQGYGFSSGHVWMWEWDHKESWVLLNSRFWTVVLEKTLTPWKESYNQPRQHIKKQRHYFANKGLSSQGYGFSSGHVWMWDLDYKESWAPKNWCFWTVVLEKTLESPLDCKEIQPVHPKGDQS